MRRLLVPILLLAASPAAADCTTTGFGDFTSCNGSDGSSGTLARIGDFAFYREATAPALAADPPRPPRCALPLAAVARAGVTAECARTGGSSAPSRARG